ncbi:hypothetical protein BpHYR1_024268 [Brachionus plicatilis]|uniref:Uncharacterized protein n=1 Tax=Brachionus plicatilis TaxID=10195 RepID=A0A3M7PQ73_BRAPC|nr:hypothetical protein BpHYR1_024268 [Brachionus plicatilis]
MSKSRSRSPSRHFPKKSRNHDDLDIDESDKSKYIDLREKLNDMRRPKDKQTLQQEQDSKKTLKNESNSEVKSEVKSGHRVRSKRILKEAEVSVVVSEEESDVEFEAGTAENSESIANSAKRFKSRSRTVSKETVTDTDTDTETRSNTPRRSSVNEEIENPTERNEAIKGDFRSRSGNQLNCFKK